LAIGFRDHHDLRARHGARSLLQRVAQRQTSRNFGKVTGSELRSIPNPTIGATFCVPPRLFPGCRAPGVKHAFIDIERPPFQTIRCGRKGRRTGYRDL
jgi:hypothetical protein